MSQGRLHRGPKLVRAQCNRLEVSLEFVATEFFCAALLHSCDVGSVST